MRGASFSPLTAIARIAALAAVLSMTACAAAPDSSTPVSLDGTAWALASAASGPLQARPAEVEVTLVFATDAVSGSGGCNQYRATVTREGDTLRFGPVGATKRGCMDGRGEIEQAWFAALGQPLTVSRDGDQLVLTGADGARYALRATAPPAP